MGWASQYKDVKTYFVVHICNSGNKSCEIEELQKAFDNRKEAKEYAERMCEKMTYGYYINKLCFGKVDLS